MVGPSLPDFRLAASDRRPPSSNRDIAATRRWIDLATHILVIEDEVMIAWMLESLLEDMGFTSIALATNGEAALEAACDAAPGLIITDINLGTGMDGIAAASAIRAKSAAAIILITGYSREEARSRSVETLPGVPILRKPVQVVELQNAIARVVAGSKSSN